MPPSCRLLITIIFILFQAIHFQGILIFYVLYLLNKCLYFLVTFKFDEKKIVIIRQWYFILLTRHVYFSCSESLLIIKNVGIEITTMFASGRKSYKFIAWERISGTVVNEAVTMVKAFIETILQLSH